MDTVLNEFLSSQTYINKTSKKISHLRNKQWSDDKSKYEFWYLQGAVH
jgi:hypothetical protein